MCKPLFSRFRDGSEILRDSDTIQRLAPTATLVQYSGNRQDVVLLDASAAHLDDIQSTISITSTASAKAPEHALVTPIKTQPIESGIRSATIEMAQIRYKAAQSAYKHLLDQQGMELKQKGMRHPGSKIEKQLAITRTQYWESISLDLPAEGIAELASSITSLEQKLASIRRASTSSEDMAPKNTIRPRHATVFSAKERGYIVLYEMLNMTNLWHCELWPLMFRSQYPEFRNIPDKITKNDAIKLLAKHKASKKVKRARRQRARPDNKENLNAIMVAALVEVVASKARPDDKTRLLEAANSMSLNSKVNPIVID